MSSTDAIAQSNAGHYDLHLALHSDAAPDSLSGVLRGIILYYPPNNPEGQRAAQDIANGLKELYPLPELVRVSPNPYIGELTQVEGPAAFLEIAYHDNIADALWMQNNLDGIAKSIAASLSKYFGTTSPDHSFTPILGMVHVPQGVLSIRDRPREDGLVIATAADRSNLTILNEVEDWYLVQFGNVLGYAGKDYITPIFTGGAGGN